MFTRLKKLCEEAKLFSASRLATTVTGCTTGIFFTAKNVFSIPLDKIMGGRLPLLLTTLLSTTVLLFKANKNVKEAKYDEEHSLNITFNYLKSSSTHTGYVLEKLQIKRVSLENQSPVEMKATLHEIYNRLLNKDDTLEKYAYSFFWALMQFISHFAPDMLSRAFQQQSLYSFNSEEIVSLNNLIFAIVLALAFYNGTQTFHEELKQYDEPKLADLHFTIVHAFTPKLNRNYGTFAETIDLENLKSSPVNTL